MMMTMMMMHPIWMGTACLHYKNRKKNKKERNGVEAKQYLKSKNTAIERKILNIYRIIAKILLNPREFFKK